MFAVGRPVMLADRPLFFNVERRLQRDALFCWRNQPQTLRLQSHCH